MAEDKQCDNDIYSQMNYEKVRQENLEKTEELYKINQAPDKNTLPTTDTSNVVKLCAFWILKFVIVVGSTYVMLVAFDESSVKFINLELSNPTIVSM